MNLQVSDLINFQTRRWHRETLEELFISADVSLLLFNQPVISEKDSSVWRFNHSGVYSVRSGYDISFSDHHKDLIQTVT